MAGVLGAPPPPRACCVRAVAARVPRTYHTRASAVTRPKFDDRRLFGMLAL